MLVFSQEIHEVGLSLEFLKKKNENFVIGGR